MQKFSDQHSGLRKPPARPMFSIKPYCPSDNARPFWQAESSNRFNWADSDYTDSSSSEDESFYYQYSSQSQGQKVQVPPQTHSATSIAWQVRQASEVIQSKPHSSSKDATIKVIAVKPTGVEQFARKTADLITNASRLRVQSMGKLSLNPRILKITKGVMTTITPSDIEGYAALTTRAEALLRDKIYIEDSLNQALAAYEKLKGDKIAMEMDLKNKLSKAQSFNEELSLKVAQAKVREGKLRSKLFSAALPQAKEYKKYEESGLRQRIASIKAGLNSSTINRESIFRVLGELEQDLARLTSSTESCRDASHIQLIEKNCQLLNCLSLSQSDIGMMRLSQSLAYKKAVTENKGLSETLRLKEAERSKLREALSRSQTEQMKYRSQWEHSKSLVGDFRRSMKAMENAEQSYQSQIERSNIELEELTHKLTEKDIQRFAKKFKRYSSDCRSLRTAEKHNQSVDAMLDLNRKLTEKNEKLYSDLEDLRTQLVEVQSNKETPKSIVVYQTPTDLLKENEMLRGLVQRYACDTAAKRASLKVGAASLQVSGAYK
mmetsp:Transcript_28756/g.51164  ORF Transcript_28756/g.51164 Transcript_28756/m.51164 type:complete len:548 (-) Transcript_28756:2967-4610(-)